MRFLSFSLALCCGVWLTATPASAQSLLSVDDVFGLPHNTQSESISHQAIHETTVADQPHWTMNSIQQVSDVIVPPAIIAFDDSDKADKDETEEKDDEPTLEERLKALEEGWKKLDGAWDKFETAEKKKKSDAAKKPTYQLNGRIHADYWDFVHQSDGIGFFEHPDPAKANFGDDPEDRFAFRRIRLELKGDILETMLYRIQVDFNNPQTPELKDVYLGFKELPGNQTLLIGNQKRPLGLDHLNSSKNNVFIERPFVVEAFNEDARRMGIAMYGHTDAEDLIWTYGVFHLESLPTTGRVIGDSRQMSINGRLGGSPWYDETSDGRGYFHWAVAGMVGFPDGNNDPAETNDNEARFRTRADGREDMRWLDTGRIDGANSYEIIGLESLLNVGPLQLVGEYQHNWLQRDTGPQVQTKGAYCYLSYMLTGEHIPYERTTGTLGRLEPFENFFLVDNCCGGTSCGWGAWGVAARYNYIDLTDGDIQGGVGQSVTGAVNWYWNAYSKMQFDCSYGEITEHAPVGGFTSGNYLLIGTRFAIEF